MIKQNLVDLLQPIARVEEDPSVPNLERDLGATEWLVAKVRSRKSYAQNLYAALCNNEFQKQEVWPVLSNETWCCSWRYSGGIIADLEGKGDYLDWYCSGIRGVDFDANNADDPTKEYVGEGEITEEILEDLAKLGWAPLPNSNEYD